MKKRVSSNSPYMEAAVATAKLVEEKQVAYGDAFGKAGNIIRELYPNGVRPDQFEGLLAITRIIDKFFRIATKKDAFGESPWHDVHGYATLMVVKENSKKKNEMKKYPNYKQSSHWVR
jgi:hypothetical protein